MISGNMVGSYSQIGKTFILQDENGNEVAAVVVDQETVFDATVADVRIGKTFASDEGVKQGENTITYRTRAGYRAVTPGQMFSIPMSDYDQYEYTKLQCIIVPYNTSFANSVAAEKTVIGDCVYAVGSVEKIADVLKNAETKSIDLNINNDTENIYLIHYFTYREED